MVFTKITEYFSTQASVITEDEVLSNLAAGEQTKAFESAEASLESFKNSGSKEEIAMAMVASATVALAFDDAEQAKMQAEGALAIAQKAGDLRGQAAAMDVIAQADILWNPLQAVAVAKEALGLAAKADRDGYLKACVSMTVANALLAAGKDDEAVRIAQDMTDSSWDAKDQGMALVFVAETAIAAGQYKEAKTAANDAADKLEGSDAKKALAVKCEASASLKLPEFLEEGFELAEKALGLFEGSDDRRSPLVLKLDMARAKLDATELVESEDWAEEAARGFKDLGDHKNNAEAAFVLATIRLTIALQEATNKDDCEAMTATQACRDALSLFKKIGDKRGEALTTQKLSQIRYHSGAGDMAKMAAEDAAAMFTELGDELSVAASLLTAAKAMHRDKLFDGARRAATKALGYYKSAGDKVGEKECQELINQSAKGDSEKKKSDKVAAKTISDEGIVKLVNSVEEGSHLLSFFADVDDAGEDEELGEFDLKQWGSAGSMLKIM